MKLVCWIAFISIHSAFALFPSVDGARAFCRLVVRAAVERGGHVWKTVSHECFMPLDGSKHVRRRLTRLDARRISGNGGDAMNDEHKLSRAQKLSQEAKKREQKCFMSYVYVKISLLILLWSGPPRISVFIKQPMRWCIGWSATLALLLHHFVRSYSALWYPFPFAEHLRRHRRRLQRSALRRMGDANEIEKLYFFDGLTYWHICYRQ